MAQKTESGSHDQETIDAIPRSIQETNLGIIEERDSGFLTEKDRMLAAKQILLGVAILWALAMVLASVFPTKSSQSFLEVCKTSLPPLATLIIAFYFKEKGY